MATGPTTVFTAQVNTAQAQADLAALQQALANAGKVAPKQIPDPTVQFRAGLKATVDAVGQLRDATGKLVVDSNGLAYGVKNMAAGTKVFVDAAARLRAANGQFVGLSNITVGGAAASLPNPAGNFNAGITQATTNVGQFQAVLSRLSGFLAGYVGFRALTDQIVAVGDALIQSEAIAARLRFSTGDATKAAQEQDFLKETADRLGTSYVSLAEGYSKFAAATKGSPIEGEKTRQIFLGVAEASKVLKLSAEETKGTIYALQQMVSKGKVSAEEFRQQLGERLPLAMRAAEIATGKTKEEFNNLLDNGKIDPESFLPAFGAALRKLAKDDLEVAAASFQSNLARVDNAVFNLRENLGKGELGKALNDTVKQLNTALRDGSVQEGVNLIGLAVAKTITFGVQLLGGVIDLSKKLGLGFASVANLVVVAFEALPPKISQIFNNVIDSFKQLLAGAVEAAARIAEKVGLDGLSSKLDGVAGGLRKSAEENRKAAAAAGKDAAAALQYFKDRQKYLDEQYALLNKPKPASSPPRPGAPPITDGGPVKFASKDKDAKGALSAQKALDDALASSALAAAKSRREVARAQLEADFAARIKTQQQYLDEKAALDKKEVDEEIAIKQQLFEARAASLNTVNTKDADKAANERKKITADLVKIGAEIEALQNKKVVIDIQLKQSQKSRTESAQQLLDDIGASILEAQGNTLQAVLRRVALEEQRLLQDVRVRGDAELEALVRKQAEFKRQAATADNASRNVGLARGVLSLQEEQINDKRRAGLLSESQAQDQLKAARERVLPIIKANIDLLEKEAELTNDPQKLLSVAQLRQEYERLSTSTHAVADSLNQEFWDGVRQGITDAISGTKSWGDALKGALSNALAKFAELALQMALFKAFGAQTSGGGGGVGGFLAGLLGSSIPARAGGGEIRGPGTTTSDSILAWLSDKEYVLRASAVEAIGVRNLDYMNKYGRLPGFSTGGQASRAAASMPAPTVRAGDVSVSPILAMDSDSLGEAILGSAAGERHILRIIAKNGGQVKRVIG